MPKNTLPDLSTYTSPPGLFPRRQDGHNHRFDGGARGVFAQAFNQLVILGFDVPDIGDHRAADRIVGARIPTAPTGTHLGGLPDADGDVGNYRNDEFANLFFSFFLRCGGSYCKIMGELWLLYGAGLFIGKI